MSICSCDYKTEQYADDASIGVASVEAMPNDSHVEVEYIKKSDTRDFDS